MKNKNILTLKNIIFILAFILSLVYFFIYIKNSINDINYMQKILNSIFLIIILFFTTVSICGTKTLKNIFSGLTGLLIIITISLNLLINYDIINLPTNELIKDFKDTPLTELTIWAKEKNIIVNTNYEYSDNIKEGNIITQDVNNEIVKLVKEINVLVSSGPNYDKELILSSMIGKDSNSLLTFIEQNHLKNVELIYEVSNDYEKDIIISQSTTGEIKRNTELTFKISLGNNIPTNIILTNLENKKEFDATYYLKQNSIKYNLEYDYSSSIKRGYIISQSIKKDTEININNDTITLVISKGNKIIVPDFNNKTLENVIEWITNNNLKINFIEKYDNNIEKGKLISIDKNPEEIIEEETRINVTISKGPLLVPTFTSHQEFINWANTYKIKYTESYEYNDSVKKGGIINLSIPSGNKINPELDQIAIKISYGSPVTIPNVIGKSEGEIRSICSSIGLSCGFYNTGYSSTPNNHATKQSIGAGAKVVSGTYMSIGLSSGPAQTFNIYIQDTWFDIGNANGTINSLKNKLSSACPGVNFEFATAPDNSSPAGIIHRDSPIKGGNNSFTQGNTYKIIVVQ